jgi:hypothetical protein
MTPEILNVLAGTTGVIGLLSIICYLYYSLRSREIQRSEKSIKSLIEGEGLLNGDQVLQALQQFKDDESRLSALKTFANLTNNSAERVYTKIKANVDLTKLEAGLASGLKKLSLLSASFFVLIALVALIYSMTSGSTSNSYSYLPKDSYNKGGFLDPFGWGSEPTNDALRAQNEPLKIYPTGAGTWDPQITFLLSSSSVANVSVERLYIKLKSYEQCTIGGDYHKGTLGEQGVSTTSFFISEKYDQYPIKPLNPNLTSASWTYKGLDQNEFVVGFESKPYVLYILSINVDYQDLAQGKNKHAESPLFSTIFMNDRNMGGCSEVDQWFSAGATKQPASANYDDSIPYDIYQLLTANLSENPGLMNVFLKNPVLANENKLIQAIVSSRPDNTVFGDNYKKWAAALSKKN